MCWKLDFEHHKISCYWLWTYGSRNRLIICAMLARALTIAAHSTELIICVYFISFLHIIMMCLSLCAPHVSLAARFFLFLLVFSVFIVFARFRFSRTHSSRCLRSQSFVPMSALWCRACDRWQRCVFFLQSRIAVWQKSSTLCAMMLIGDDTAASYSFSNWLVCIMSCDVSLKREE